VKWWGKSPPLLWQQGGHGKPYQEQSQAVGGWLVPNPRVDCRSGIGNDIIEIDETEEEITLPAQNPAYDLPHYFLFFSENEMNPVCM